MTQYSLVQLSNKNKMETQKQRKKIGDASVITNPEWNHFIKSLSYLFTYY